MRRWHRQWVRQQSPCKLQSGLGSIKKVLIRTDRRPMLGPQSTRAPKPAFVPHQPSLGDASLRRLPGRPLWPSWLVFRRRRATAAFPPRALALGIRVGAAKLMTAVFIICKSGEDAAWGNTGRRGLNAAGTVCLPPGRFIISQPAIYVKAFFLLAMPFFTGELATVWQHDDSTCFAGPTGHSGTALSGV